MINISLEKKIYIKHTYLVIVWIFTILDSSFAKDHFTSKDILTFIKSTNPSVLSELSSHNYTHDTKNFYSLQTPSEFIIDKKIGFKHRPSSKVHHILRTNTSIIYNSTYTFDKFSRRINPQQKIINRSKFLILQGCSLIYGNGLNDDETLSHFLNISKTKFHTYNYGIGASGPNMHLAKLQENTLKNEVYERNGYLIFFYINEHIARSNGFMDELTWIKDTPFYETIDNRLVRNGTFSTGEPIRTKVLELLKNTLNYRKFFNQNFPKIRDSHINYTCKIIEESKNIFEKKYPKSKYIFAVHPLSFIDKRLSDCLKTKNVTIIDFNKILRINESSIRSEYVIPMDGHPNKLMNITLAAKILEMIK
jgi:hypothetical protein